MDGSGWISFEEDFLVFIPGLQVTSERCCLEITLVRKAKQSVDLNNLLYKSEYFGSERWHY